MNFLRSIQQLRTRTLVGGTALLSLLMIFAGAFTGDASEFFGEGRIGTLVSVLLLFVTAWTCFKIYRLRQQAGSDQFFKPQLIWLIIALGFLFLGLDDALLIHEGIDRSIHEHGGFDQSAWTDRIDDLIIGVYALIGLGFLYVFRAEINRYRFLISYLVVGFGVMCVTFVFDLMSNGVDLFIWLGATQEGASFQKKLLRALEEAGELVAVAIFLSGFLRVLSVVSIETDG